ncbi:MAG: 5-formyltetrahydrofolate cyclo-ligase [Arenicella sp.]|jgi:5-formyltetrahydrofolate cyclo-ligase
MEAQNSLTQHARKSNRLLQAQHILSYAPFAGEISPAKLVRKLACETVHLPRITNFRLSQMRFYSADKVDSLNKYGIQEPRPIGAPRPANRFDVLLIPLVAFDRSGTRMGMGAGYYDRALEALNYQTSTKPYLIGLAHHFQEVNSLAREPWDVPLDAILTDREFIQIQLKETE